jgi:soluble lytic murein transglycosylase
VRKRSAEGLRRPRILLAAGYVELARAELRALRGSRLDLADRLELAQLLSETGDFYSSYRVVQTGSSGDLAAGPIPRAEEMWWYAWPDAFPAEVDAAILQRGAAPRELVYAIMREESGYRPKVLSPVGAYGLMQIMPTTGELLARDTGFPDFEADDLLVPAINVRFGAYYLGQLSAQFPDRLSAAIASYNAGPNAVSEWIELNPEREDDEWVEAIPYDETRRYVKRVLRSVHAYRVLY